jgi:hypothetical protein
MAEGGGGPRTRLARFYMLHLLPEHGALLTQARAGAETLYDLTPEDFAA